MLPNTVLEEVYRKRRDLKKIEDNHPNDSTNNYNKNDDAGWGDALVHNKEDTPEDVDNQKGSYDGIEDDNKNNDSKGGNTVLGGEVKKN